MENNQNENFNNVINENNQMGNIEQVNQALAEEVAIPVSESAVEQNVSVPINTPVEQSLVNPVVNPVVQPIAQPSATQINQESAQQPVDANKKKSSPGLIIIGIIAILLFVCGVIGFPYIKSMIFKDKPSDTLVDEENKKENDNIDNKDKNNSGISEEEIEELLSLAPDATLSITNNKISINDDSFGSFYILNVLEKSKRYTGTIDDGFTNYNKDYMSEEYTTDAEEPVDLESAYLASDIDAASKSLYGVTFDKLYTKSHNHEDFAGATIMYSDNNKYLLVSTERMGGEANTIVYNYDPQVTKNENGLIIKTKAFYVYRGEFDNECQLTYKNGKEVQCPYFEYNEAGVITEESLEKDGEDEWLKSHLSEAFTLSYNYVLVDGNYVWESTSFIE